MLAGDVIAKALEMVGVTPDRVETWLGEACHCNERKERINDLHRWAMGTVAGKVQNARYWLERIME